MINRITLLLFIGLAWGQSTTIAVFDLENNGLQDSEVRILTDRLQSELVKMGGYTVVERKKIEKVFEEQEFQMSGCVEECLIEIGMLLGAKQIVIGDVGKFGSTYTINARLVDATTGEIIRASDFDTDGSIEGLLKTGMQIIATELSRQRVSSSIKQSNTILPEFDWVLVEGGTFQMGSDDGMDDEKPVHKVSLSDYYISKTEVTYNQYKIFCEATGRDNWFTDKETLDSNNWDVLFITNFNCNKGDYPQVGLEQDDAIAFCDWLGRLIGKTVRLPTEAEWEYAARGGNKSKGYEYSGSNNIDEVAWYWRNSGDEYLDGDYVNIRTYYSKYNPNNDCRLHPVAQKKPNELGLYDMSGNALEWCSDYYNPTFYSRWGNQMNPLNDRGMDEDESIAWQTVMRGGAWNSSDNECSNTSRALFVPVAHASGIDGLRPVMEK